MVLLHCLSREASCGSRKTVKARRDETPDLKRPHHSISTRATVGRKRGACMTSIVENKCEVWQSWHVSAANETVTRQDRRLLRPAEGLTRRALHVSFTYRITDLQIDPCHLTDTASLMLLLADSIRPHSQLEAVLVTDAGLDTLRAENVAVRAELAGRSARWHEGQSGRAEGSSAPLEPTERRELPAASPTEELADAVERRLTSRLGLQVLQLSEVLQRVVQSQATLTQQLTSGPAGAKAKARSSRSVDGLKPASAACAEPRAASEDRKQAIEELYKELRQLEAEVPSRARRF
eukprot:s3359_g6.t1